MKSITQIFQGNEHLMDLDPVEELIDYCSDLTFFEDVQQSYAHIIKRNNLIVAKGVVRRTGARGVSIRAAAAWSLDELYEKWMVSKINQVDMRRMNQIIS